MTQYLPPNLLALFAPRDPLPFLPPPDKLPHEKKTRGYLGVGNFLADFEVCCQIRNDEHFVRLLIANWLFIILYRTQPIHHRQLELKHAKNGWNGDVRKKQNKLLINWNGKSRCGIQIKFKKPLKIRSKHYSSLAL